MAEEKKETGKKSFLGNTFPIILLAIIFAILALHLSGVINLPDVKDKILNIFGGGGGGNTENDAFAGSWATLSPVTYYGQDIDGERYVEYTANIHLYIEQEGKGYLGNSWLTELTYKAVPGAITPLTPLVPNPDGSYSGPLSFDARGYLEPQPGISSFELVDNKMTINTQLFGGNSRIVLTLVESGEKFGYGDKLYASLSVIPTSSGQAMGEVADSDIILTR